MYAQVIQGGTTPDARERMNHIVTDEMIPALEAEPGFAGALNLADPTDGNGMMVVLWETEIQARRALGEYGSRVPEGARRDRRDLDRQPAADDRLGGQRPRLRGIPSPAAVDETPQTGEFVVGDAFARTLTETTQSLVCVLDRDGRILLFNEACERATGFRRDEVIGRDARDVVIPPEEREAFGEFLAYVWKTGTPSPQVGHWLTKAGGRRLVAWSNRLMADAGGAPVSLVTTGIDLTDRAPHATRTSARWRAIPRRSSPRSAGSRPSSARSGAWPRSSRRR